MYGLLEKSEVKMYKIYENNGVYEIYSAYGQLVASCISKARAEYLLAKLNKNIKILNKQKERKIKRS